MENTSRDNLRESLSFKEPPRVVVDLGATTSTGIAAIAYTRPKAHLGVDRNRPLLRAPRISDMLRFFGEIQEAYYKTMHGHLKQLGVRVPINGTNQQFVVADCRIDAAINDFMSRNQYWRHPNRQAKPFYTFANQPLLGVDMPTQRNPLSVIARTSVAGKPQGVAEFNFPWPNEYRCEGLLLAAAYSCLQDWDMFLLFSYGLNGKLLSMFRSQSDPARWGTFPAAALMFHRSDVAPARNVIHVVHEEEDAFTPRPHSGRMKYTNYRFLTFTSKVRNVFVEESDPGTADVVLACGLSASVPVVGTANVMRFQESPWEKWLYPAFLEAARGFKLPGYGTMQPAARRFDSDTGELSLNYGDSLLIINTARSKGAIGDLAKNGAIDLSGLCIVGDSPFAALIVTSLDGAPIGTSRRLLLTAVGRAENTAQGFWPPTPEQRARSYMSWMLPAEGRLPVIAEPVRATVQVKVPGKAVVYALDPTGKRREQLKAIKQNGTVTLTPATARSIWCEIVVP